jgi:uncharacterized protein (PEP-CTERM system associated)
MAITTVKVPRLAPIALALLALAPQCHAAWRLTPFVDVTQTFTDNVALEPSGQEHAQWVSDVAPGFTLVDRTPRLSVEAMARQHYFVYLGKRQRNTAEQQTQYAANGQAVIVQDYFYLDAAASGGPQAVSPFGPQVTANLWAQGNRANVRTWRVSPYLRHRFGNTADLTVRYVRDGVDAGRNLLGSSKGETEMAHLASGRRFETLGWSLDVSHQVLDNTLAGPSTSDNAEGKVRLNVARTFALTASGGYDRYDFQSLGGRTAGRNWSGGFAWAPSNRTKLEASVGHRYFGPTASLAFSHRTRHSVWMANYSDAITTSRAQFLLPASIDTASMLDKLFVTSFPDPEARAQAVQAYIHAAGLPQTLADSVNYFSNRYLRQKQKQAALLLDGAHSSLLVSVYDTRRVALSVQQTDTELLGSQLANLDADTRQLGISSVYSRRLNSRTTALVTAQVGRNQSLSTGRVQDVRLLRVGVTRQLRDRMQFAVEARHASGATSELTTRAYTENAVSATISVQL